MQAIMLATPQVYQAEVGGRTPQEGYPAAFPWPLLFQLTLSPLRWCRRYECNATQLMNRIVIVLELSCFLRLVIW